jgi:hypothetical protein
MVIRDRHDLPKQAADLYLFAERASVYDMPERKDMNVPALILGQPQDPGDAVKHRRRYLATASLFQVRVPGSTETGENRDFLPPQPWGPAVAGRWQADLFWPQALPPRPQEHGEFQVLPLPARHASFLQHAPAKV